MCLIVLSVGDQVRQTRSILLLSVCSLHVLISHCLQSHFAVLVSTFVLLSYLRTLTVSSLGKIASVVNIGWSDLSLIV